MAEHKPNKVEFTRQQLEFLERTFPELTGGPSTTHDERVWAAGQRSVVSTIRALTRYQGM